jgi:hypothetical protein
MKILIFGKGTVGTALGELIEKGGHEVAYQDKHAFIENRKWDIIHITFPMKEMDAWIGLINGYSLYNFSCKYLIIESSIIPQALDHLEHPCIIYSPIRATEAIMPLQLKTEKKFWAFVEDPPIKDQYEVIKYFNSVYPQGTLRFDDAKALAFGKMLEVVDFGLQIIFAQQVKLECDKHGWNFDEAYTEYRKHSQYGADYNKLKKGAPKQWIKRAIFRPGVIGGKCVIQDAKLLQEGSIMKDIMDLMIATNWIFKEWEEK